MSPPPPCEKQECHLQEALVTIIALSKTYVKILKLKLKKADERIEELENTIRENNIQ
jgi:hypothetical protein